MEPMTGNRRKRVTDSLIQDETPGGPAYFDGFTASNNEVSKEAWTVDESKSDRWRPSSSKSCEGLTIGWC